MKTLEGKLVAKDMKVGIVAARFNEFIVSKLIGGAVDGLTSRKQADPGTRQDAEGRQGERSGRPEELSQREVRLGRHQDAGVCFQHGPQGPGRIPPAQDRRRRTLGTRHRLRLRRPVQLRLPSLRSDGPRPLHDDREPVLRNAAVPAEE